MAASPSSEPLDPSARARDSARDRRLLDGALAGEIPATRALVHALTPVVQARVARVLLRNRRGSARDVRQEVEDLVQDVFAALFEDGGRRLRAWDASRGASLASFCGLVAEHEAASILRSGRRSPWTDTATEASDLEEAMHPEPGAELQIASREQLHRLAQRLQETLSPLGLQLFQRLVVDEESVESVGTTMKMTADAVYAWRSRLGKTARALLVEIGASEPRLPRAEQAAPGHGANRRKGEEPS